MKDVALLFPPFWYFSAVPADLSYTAGRVRAQGVPVRAWNGSAAFTRHWFAPQIAPYQRPDLYGTPAQADAQRAWYAATTALGNRFSTRIGPRHVRMPMNDSAHVYRLLERGRDLFRNPALPVLEEGVGFALDAGVIGIALVHPDQRPHALTLAFLLRERGFTGQLVLYGALEDVLSPLDFAADLVGDHALFTWFDGVILGDAGDAFVALAKGEPVPNLIRRGDSALPVRHQQPLVDPPVFDFVKPADHPYPTPVVDLRLGRGCPWGRCTFCAIQAHHPGYRAGPIERVITGMQRAHTALGTIVFRVRDDLITPRQLRELGAATATLDFSPVWTARVRFTSGLTREVLAQAQAGGLAELGIGLESAVPRVRELMQKGVPQRVVLRVIEDAASLGLRVRALCMIGFPGETPAEATATLDFLEAHRHQLAGFSLTPYHRMRAAPDGDTRRLGPERMDNELPVPESPSFTDNEKRILELSSFFPEPGPDPMHRLLYALG